MSVCTIKVDDGITFDEDSIEPSEIRKAANYSGTRLTLTGLVGRAKCPAQVEIGYGDAIALAPKSAVYPSIFQNTPAPHLLVYPVYPLVAETLEAIISLGRQLAD